MSGIDNSTAISILSVKDKEEGLVVKFGIGDNKFQMSSSQMPMQSFVDALDALKADVMEICEFPKEYGERLKVTGVHLQRKASEEGDTITAVITAVKTLINSNSPLNITTPRRYVEAIKEGSLMLGSETVLRIRALCREAQMYVQGNSALKGINSQLHLDLGDLETVDVIEDDEDEGEDEDEGFFDEEKE